MCKLLYKIGWINSVIIYTYIAFPLNTQSRVQKLMLVKKESLHIYSTFPFKVMTQIVNTNCIDMLLIRC